MINLYKIMIDMAAVFVALVIVLLVSGCGGAEPIEDEISEEERLIQFCEAQDLDAQLLSVYNVDTGESYLDVQCIKPEKLPKCKVNNPVCSST